MISKIITAVCSFFFVMIGADKFFGFLEPACSLEDSISTAVWTVLGVIQIISAVLIWLPKTRKYVVGFFFVFMLVFTAVHLSQGTYDVGGAVFMAALLGLLVWDPSFIHGKKGATN